VGLPRVARECSRYLHATQILLSRSTSRVITWLECIVRRWKTDIPDMLTTVPHAWILDIVERRVIAVSRADRESHELQMYGLTGSIPLLLCQGAQSLRSLPDDGGC
jgi:hypothetical protein